TSFNGLRLQLINAGLNTLDKRCRKHKGKAVFHGFVLQWTSLMKVHSMAKWRWLEHVRDREQLLRLKVLENVPLFPGLSRRQLGKVLVRFFEKENPSAELIFGDGWPVTTLFILPT